MHKHSQILKWRLESTPHTSVVCGPNFQSSRQVNSIITFEARFPVFFPTNKWNNWTNPIKWRIFIWGIPNKASFIPQRLLIKQGTHCPFACYWQVTHCLTKSELRYEYLKAHEIVPYPGRKNLQLCLLLHRPFGSGLCYQDACAILSELIILCSRLPLQNVFATPAHAKGPGLCYEKPPGHQETPWFWQWANISAFWTALRRQGTKRGTIQALRTAVQEATRPTTSAFFTNDHWCTGRHAGKLSVEMHKC